MPPWRSEMLKLQILRPVSKPDGISQEKVFAASTVDILAALKDGDSYGAQAAIA